MEGESQSTQKRSTILIAALVLVSAAITVAAGIVLFREFIAPRETDFTLPPAGTPTSPPLPTPTSIIHRGPIIVNAIRSESKLETFRMTLVNDQEVMRVSGIGGICTERIVYLGYYDVTAGVDLSKITDQDVVVVDRNGQMTVTLTLPPAEIVDVTLDTEHSRLVLQETPTWIPGCETQVADMTLEAQHNIREYVTRAALEAGILTKAQERAGFSLQRLLYDVGYPNVVIRYGDQD